MNEVHLLVVLHLGMHLWYVKVEMIFKRFLQL